MSASDMARASMLEDQWIDNSSMADRDPTLTVDKNGQRHFSQMAWINKRPTTSIAAQVTPGIENAFDFDPPDPRTIDMSPRGTMAITSRAMPTDRVSRGQHHGQHDQSRYDVPNSFRA
jgi:hypothetical protein